MFHAELSNLPFVRLDLSLNTRCQTENYFPNEYLWHWEKENTRFSILTSPLNVPLDSKILKCYFEH